MASRDPERAWGLVFLWLVLSPPNYMLLPTGSCNWSNFPPPVLSADTGFSVLSCVGNRCFSLQWITFLQVENTAWKKEQLLFQPESLGSICLELGSHLTGKPKDTPTEELDLGDTHKRVALSCQCSSRGRTRVPSCLSGGIWTQQFPSKTSLGVLCHALVVPFRPRSCANSSSFLFQKISIHFHQYHNPPFSDSFLLEPKGLTLPPALASPSVIWGGTVIKNALEPGRCSQASRMQEKAGTSYFGQLGKESLKNSLGLSMCFQNSKSICYTLHPSLIFHFNYHHKEVID